MAFERFREWRPQQATIQVVCLCNEIIEELSDYRLTLRQLYYQLVSRNEIPNTEREYKKLSRVVSRARLAGLMDWEAVEDRNRVPRIPVEFCGLEDLAEAALRSYRLPRWQGQDYYAELWVEKDALASVLQPLATDYHVPMMVNRGYSSSSAMKEAAERYRVHQGKQSLVLFYLGDMDPSGEDMVRDIRDRLAEFWIADIDVCKIALTVEQVQQFDPPPNPAKFKDPRAKDYIAKYGTQSWEVDALPPRALGEIIRVAFDQVLNRELMDQVIVQEVRDKEKLLRQVNSL
ncbi:MAG: hypothetical protein ACYSR6_00150 [Planctomycetota bacterium]|jgi:hypothetical protein